jgi:hypothetical protein
MGASLALIMLLEDQQLADFRERKPRLLGTPDELNPLNVVRIEEAEAAFGPRRALQEAPLS